MGRLCGHDEKLSPLRVMLALDIWSDMRPSPAHPKLSTIEMRNFSDGRSLLCSDGTRPPPTSSQVPASFPPLWRMTRAVRRPPVAPLILFQNSRWQLRSAKVRGLLHDRRHTPLRKGYVKLSLSPEQLVATTAGSWAQATRRLPVALARANKLGGKVRPTCFAALTLMTEIKFCGLFDCIDHAVVTRHNGLRLFLHYSVEHGLELAAPSGDRLQFHP